MHALCKCYTEGRRDSVSYKQTEKSYKEGASILYLSVDKNSNYCLSSSKDNHLPTKHRTYCKDLNPIAGHMKETTN